MKQNLLNAEASIELYKDNESKINPKDCYINIFNVLTTYPRRFGTGEWKIAYGYVSSIENVFCRHCFIFAEEKVIDPTIFSTERDNSERIYYPTKIFDDVSFEIDENGKPWWVCERVDKTVGLIGGTDVVGVVLVDASNKDNIKAADINY